MAFVQETQYSSSARVSCGKFPKLTWMLSYPTERVGHEYYQEFIESLNLNLECYCVATQVDVEGDQYVCAVIKLKKQLSPAQLRTHIKGGSISDWSEMLYCPISSTRKGGEFYEGANLNPLMSETFENNERRKPHLHGLDKKRKIKERVVFKKQQDEWISEKKELFELIVKCDWSTFSKPDNCDRFISSWNAHADKQTKPDAFARGSWHNLMLRKLVQNLHTKKLVHMLFYNLMTDKIAYW